MPQTACVAYALLARVACRARKRALQNSAEHADIHIYIYISASTAQTELPQHCRHIWRSIKMPVHKYRARMPACPAKSTGVRKLFSSPASMQTLDRKSYSRQSMTVTQHNPGAASPPCIGNVLLPVELIPIQREREGCDVANRVHVRVAGLQLAVDLQGAHNRTLQEEAVSMCLANRQEVC